MRLVIHAVHPAGFPIDIELEPDERERVDAIVERLVRQGYRAPGSAWPTGPDGAPMCLKHGGVLMTRRSKQSDEWWSHKVVTSSGQELYCRGVPYGERAQDGYYQ